MQAMIPFSCLGRLEQIIGKLPRVEMRSGLAEAAPELLAPYAGKSLLLVCDENTWPALGERLAQKLHVPVHHFTAPQADDSHAAALEAALDNADMLLAVGGGTINDLCKLASHRRDKPYIAFPTAPSMNGFLSATASIAVRGHKQSLSAALPLAVFCDSDVLAAAPMRLIQAGFGDSLARPTAQTDWLFSHHMLGTAYDTLPFEMTANVEAEVFALSQRLAERDVVAIEALMNLLLLSGLGMTVSGGSHPASGAEHMLAHGMHMQLLAELRETWHGEEIAVTTLLMAEYQAMRIAEIPTLFSDTFPLDEMQRLYGQELADSMRHTHARKAELIGNEEQANSKLRHIWPELRPLLQSIAMPPRRLRTMLEALGAPSSLSALNWPEHLFRDVMATARFTRDRFTFLDCG